MKERKLNIVLAPDENYAVHAGVVMLSALKQAKHPQNFHFYFLVEKEILSSKSKKKLEDIAARYSATVQFVELDASAVRHLPANNHLTISAYYRVLIASILLDVNRCIYLDCDVIVLDDLDKLWTEDITGVALGVANDWLNEKLERRKFPEIRHYFNSGMLCMNLQHWRAHGYQRACLKKAQESPALCERFADQDLLNVIFCNDRKMLHQRWNIQGSMNAEGCRHLRNEEDTRLWQELRRSPGIAHFIGKSKPWHFNFESDWAITYWNTLAQTPWASEYRHDIWKARKIWLRNKARNFKAQAQLYLKKFVV